MAQAFKGKPVADVIREQVGQDVEAWKTKGHAPKMAVLLVEGDPASFHYAQAKGKAAEKLGIDYELHTFPPDVTEAELLATIGQLNDDRTVHGIMLELPLPKHIDTKKATAAIAPFKDVDGLTPHNLLATVNGSAGLYPATPQACIALLKHYGHTLAGKHVVLVGRGETVGLPLIHLLLRENATVTVCHSRTPDIGAHIRQADIAFVAVGRKNLVTPDMVHPNLLLIDAGINETEDGGIVGDVAPEVIDHVAGMSPTPGGVGSVTTALLFSNLMQAMALQSHNSQEVELNGHV
ncbi:bifunctional 5,10-methylene-tetrahydrofolate dehydrogenase/5,10-methylene-tetrahydrofolate cyclohydrolase [Tumebacillus algifaecis]|uniref:Bifunctional protein FolD n=1 Tax=Tumebacillus algifaecis TaxID=1214604 RepID=A0A223D3K1_9BACL|nr:bifunctional 5,10-methylenetetrahydrofolate dehydrogenase/5,10-methenyltetrahydrofolate cyclohydrolase [Tumebacillus algifaecis]ASS76228.1 bifunctional 5,10-methylene-tetrahydrofolate dehydrogenase/5,10-methylene-tetrahydrofolate cyclohydrolase [Tumebacillus algifaecis]